MVIALAVFVSSNFIVAQAPRFLGAVAYPSDSSLRASNDTVLLT